jgi:hypothetical protein
VTLFEPERGRRIVAPPCDAAGCWAGAPGAYREESDLYVVYRLRGPRPKRGYEVVIAASRDGSRFDKVWSAEKDRFGAESIERCALAHVGDTWRLYVSFVRHNDRRWRIGLVEARAVDAFDPADLVIVLDPLDLGLAAVKDPWFQRVADRWLMFTSYGTLPLSGGTGLHDTGDALSTGRTISATGVATSPDGRRWTWEGAVLLPSASGWDSFTSRMSTAVRDGDGWLGLYDGSASLAENYEERCGLVRSRDLRHWERVNVDGPSIGTTRGPGGVRYVDITAVGDVFYEYTRPDGAHELRVTHTG